MTAIRMIEGGLGVIEAVCLKNRQVHIVILKALRYNCDYNIDVELM